MKTRQQIGNKRVASSSGQLNMSTYKFLWILMNVVGGTSLRSRYGCWSGCASSSSFADTPRNRFRSCLMKNASIRPQTTRNISSFCRGAPTPTVLRLDNGRRAECREAVTCQRGRLCQHILMPVSSERVRILKIGPLSGCNSVDRSSDW